MRSHLAWAIPAVALALAALAGDTPSARADEKSAAALAADGNAAYRRKEYRRAAELFESAHASDPVPSLLVNAAQAWRLAGERGRAADAYAAALSVVVGPSALGAQDRAFAQQKLDELEKTVATLQIDEPRGSAATVGHVRGRAIPLVVHLAPGTYEITVQTTEGGQVRRSVELRAGEARTVSVIAPATPAGTATVGAAPASSIAPTPAPTQGSQGARDVPPAEDRAMPVARIAGWSALGLAAITGGVTVYLGVRTMDAVDEWHASDRKDTSLHDDAVALKTATNVTLVAAGGLAALGVVLLVIPVDGRREPARAQLAVGAREVRLHTRF